MFSSYLLGTLRNYDGDGDGNGNFKKAVGLVCRTTTLPVQHAFLYISLPSLHNYYVKWPNLTFTLERNKKAINFVISV